MKPENEFDYASIFLNDPLYSIYNLNDFDTNDILSLLFYSDKDKIYNRFKVIDSFCAICKKETSFNSAYYIKSG